MTREEAYIGGQKLQTYHLLDGNNIHGEMVLAPSKAESLYITTDINPEIERDKVIWIKDLDIRVGTKIAMNSLINS